MAKITLEINEIVNGVTITESPIELTSEGLLASAASAASNVTFTPTGNIAATDVQAAIAELETDRATERTASNVTFTPVGDLDSVTVQAALAELDTEKLSLAGGTMTGTVKFSDSQRIQLGDGFDFQMYHDGSNSYLRDFGTGDLIIQATNLQLLDGDGESYIQCANDGAVTLYFDNSAKANTYASGLNVNGTLTTTHIDASGLVEFNSLRGTGIATVTTILDEDDMSSNSDTALATQQSIKAYVDNTAATQTGTETLTNKTLTSPDINTPDIDGGTIDGTVIGGATPAAGSFTTISGTGNLTLGDNDKIILGDSADGLEIYHNGSNSIIDDTGTGNLQIKGNGSVQLKSSADDSIMVNAISGGAVQLRHAGSTKLATTSTGVDITGNISLDDNEKLLGGSDDDLEVYHNGSSAIIKNSTGQLKLLSDSLSIKNAADLQFLIKGTGGAGVELYHAGNKHLETVSGGVDISGNLSLRGDDRLYFGGGNQLQIFYNSSNENSVIQETGTGDLQVRANNLNILNSAGTETKASFVTDGTVELYHDNSKKFETTSTGVAITGNATTTGNVGIGITSPAEALDILGNERIQGELKIASAGASTNTVIKTNTTQSASTWDYTGKELLVDSSVTGDGNPTGVWLGNSGTSLYTIGTSQDDIDQFTLSSAYDISTASLTRTATNAFGGSIQALVFSDNGARLWVLDGGSDELKEFALSTPFDVSTIGSELNVREFRDNVDGNPTGFRFNNDGTKLILCGTAGKVVVNSVTATDYLGSYDLSTPYDITTIATSSGNKAVAPDTTINLADFTDNSTADKLFDAISLPNGIEFADSGKTLHVLCKDREGVVSFTLATAYDISSTMTVEGFANFNGLDTNPTDLYVDYTNNIALVIGQSNDYVRQYSVKNESIKIEAPGSVQVTNNFVAEGKGHFERGLSVGGRLRTYGALTVPNLTATGNIALTPGASGTIKIGNTSQTGLIEVGRSTATNTLDIQNGATASGNTATVNLGTSGASGSTTNINIGGGSNTSTTTVSGALKVASGDLDVLTTSGGHPSFAVLNTTDAALQRFNLSYHADTPGADNVIQGFAVDPYKNELFTLNVTGSPETTIIQQYEADGKRSQSANRHLHTATADLGHQELDVSWDKDGNRWFWTSENSAVSNMARFVKRFQISDGTGNDLTISNVQQYQLFTADEVTGTNSFCTPCVSLDGRYLIAEYNDYASNADTVTVKVFDLHTLLDGGAGDYSTQQLTKWSFSLNTDSSDGYPLQSMASDGTYLYIFTGNITSGNKLKVFVYTLSGTLVQEFDDFVIGETEALADDRITFDSTDSSVVLVSTDEIDFGSAHGFSTGDRVVYRNGSGSNSISGLTDGGAHFVIKVDSDKIKLATSSSNASAGTAIDFSGTNVSTLSSDSTIGPEAYELEGAGWVYHGGQPMLAMSIASGNSGERTNRVWVLGGGVANTSYGDGNRPAFISQGGNDFGVPSGEAMRFGKYNGDTDTFTENFNVEGNGNFNILTGTLNIPSNAPASASSSGTAGQITWDSNYIYVCTATNTWKRVAIATW